MMNFSKPNRSWRGPLLMAAMVVMTGCKEVLYSQLSEAEANEMVTVLQASGFEASRSRDKDGVYEVSVDSVDVAAANAILTSNGLPHKRFARMDEVFDAQGLVGSPFEERVRYTFALEQKLTEHLVSIHGVRDARVTVSLSEQPRFGEAEAPASASVILHYEPDFAVNEAVPKIKTLIANAVQGLDYERVSVVTFESQSAAVLGPRQDAGLLVGAAHADGNDAPGRPFIKRQVSSPLGTLIFSIFTILCALIGLRALARNGRTKGI